MHDVHGIAGIASVDDVVMHPRSAETLIVGRAHNPAGIDEALNSRHPVVDLLRGLRSEVGRELARRIRLR